MSAACIFIGLVKVAYSAFAAQDVYILFVCQFGSTNIQTTVVGCFPVLAEAAPDQIFQAPELGDINEPRFLCLFGLLV